MCLIEDMGVFHAQRMLLVTSETQTVYVPEVTKSSKLVMENLTECTKCNCQLLCIKKTEFKRSQNTTFSGH